MSSSVRWSLSASVGGAPGVRGRRHRVGELLVLLWVLSMADLFFTLWAQSFTPFVEGNPIARGMLLAGATGSLVVFKVGVTAIGSALFWVTRLHRRAELALWGVVVVYALLAVQWSSYTSAAVLEPGIMMIGEEGEDAGLPSPTHAYAVAAAEAEAAELEAAAGAAAR